MVIHVLDLQPGDFRLYVGGDGGEVLTGTVDVNISTLTVAGFTAALEC